MSQGKKPDYRAFISNEGTTGEKAKYTEIGAAWNVKDGGISVRLKNQPADGKFVLFVNKPKST